MNSINRNRRSTISTTTTSTGIFYKFNVTRSDMGQITLLVEIIILLVIVSCRANTPGCENRNTEWSEEREGNALNLVNHELDCGAELVLQSFKLERVGGNMRYGYVCCTSTLLGGESREVVNDFTSDGNGDTSALTEQQMSCGTDGFLKGFSLNRNAEQSTWQSTYQCLKKTSDLQQGTEQIIDCYRANTDFTEYGNGNVQFLDGLRVTCIQDYFLSEIKLEKKDDSLRYAFKCCQAITF